ncbi:alpha/beta hydrolase [Bacteroides sp. 519]|uniref:alpha/beta hydrolase n=1 Tax=Bacteroides sp. 519 TaxID=2302937 RepID=UPI0013D6FEE5|nr:alpha/beta hydrolase [Bacteroides sp. 519]NDV60731.1 alpha/beta hydrolase [Bacteroides sp. 519]
MVEEESNRGDEIMTLMKSKHILSFLLLAFTSLAHAQMDEKFYFPDKQWIPVADTIDTEDLFLTVDDDTIHALIVKPKQTPKASILFFHGNGDNVSKWLGHFRKLIDNGYQVCLFDYRGYGKSTGTPTHLNIASDAQLLFDTLLKRDDFKNTPFIIYGASIGTQAAVHTARNNNDKIMALVVDGMMASFTDVALVTSPKEYHEQIKSSLFSPYSAQEDVPYIRKIKVLFIHSPEDFMPIAQSKEVYETVACEKRFWEYTGEHVMAPLLYPDTLLKYMDELIIIK